MATRKMAVDGERLGRIGKVQRWQRRGGGIDLFCRGGRVRLEVLTPEIVRVRATGAEEFATDASWAVIKTDWPQANFTVARESGKLVVATPSLRVEIALDPLRLSFFDAAGQLLSADDPRKGIGFRAGRPEVAFAMRDGEHILGLGEKTGPLDKRGRKYEMWNRDAAPHTPNLDPLYASFPVYLAMRPSAGYARFFDNPGRSHFDFGYTEPGVARYHAADGELNYYFIYGPRPADILERYTELTGRMPLPPRWALGHQQSRYSYCPQERVKEVADGLREHRIPTDVIYIDIEHMDGYRVFTWDPECFPDPKGLLGHLNKIGLKPIIIIDPGVKRKEDYAVYEAGLEKDYFVRHPDGKHFVGRVWPGESVFPDFLNEDVRRWWGDLHKESLKLGIRGIWNDMNEVAIMGGGFGQTMDEDVVHNVDGRRISHGAVHNVYGMQMVRATREGLERLMPGERAFVLTRSAYCGAQRYSAIWLGDNSSWWEHLAAAMPMCMSVGMAGMPFVGVDIGGFFDDCTPQLYARWVQLGAFSPFCRTHTCSGTRDQEPWSFGWETERIARKYIELRYRLMPYVYTSFWQAAQSGCPVMRPLAYEFPDDETAYEVGDEFMFGDSFLVAPVYQENVTHRAVYLPAGKWVDYWTGQTHAGLAWITADAPLDTLPLYARAGSIIPTAPVVQYDGERPMDELTLEVYAGADGRFTLYEDDGHSMDFRKGAFATTDYRYEELTTGVRLTPGQRRGRYRPAKRTVVARFHGLTGTPSAATRNGEKVKVGFDKMSGCAVVTWPDDGKGSEIELCR